MKQNCLMKKGLLKIIKFYQRFISPLIGKHCRFYPTCSEYCFLSIKKYGARKGIFLAVKRILKCHPLNKGGVDIP